MEILATSSVQLGNGDIVRATHIVGDCIFECNGKSWSFSNMLAEELGFNDIANKMVAQEYRDTLSQFMLYNYFDYQAYNNI